MCDFGHKVMFVLQAFMVCGLALYADEGYSVASKVEHETCKIYIDNTQVYQRDCEFEYSPSLIFYARLGNYNDVWVFQDSPMGNACNGGDLRIFERKNATSDIVYRGKIDWCGGENPKIEVKQSTITITQEARKPNRSPSGSPNFNNEGDTLNKRRFIFENSKIK